MATAVKPRVGRSTNVGRRAQPADVLVVFGITGDLAKVMTFRSLYELERRGLLDCPIVGVAVDDWTVDDLRKRARESIEAGGDVDEEVFERFAKRLSYVAGDFADAATFERVAAAIPDAQEPGLLPRDTAVPVRRRDPRARRRRTDEERARGRREAVRARRRVRPRAERVDPRAPRRVPDLPDRPLPRQDGPRRDPVPAVRERDVRADLEPQLRLVRPDHDGGGLRRRRPRPLLRPGRRGSRRGREPPDAGGRRGGDGAARQQSSPARSRTTCSACSARCPTPTRLTTCAGRSRATARSTVCARTRRRRPTPRCGWRSTTGAGRACRSSSAPARTCPSLQTELRLVFRPPPRLGFDVQAAAASPDQLVVKLDPSTGVQLLVEAQCSEPGRARADQPRHGVRATRAGRARSPTRSCCMRR